jgi:hypothetical protein
MLPEQTYEFSAPIWLYQGQGAWHFITLPVDVAARIRHLITGPRRGWGSVRVKVSIGRTTWATSIFPYKELNSFILPIKAQVRKAEGLSLGDAPLISLTVLE